MLPLPTLTFTDWIAMSMVWTLLALVAAWFVFGLYSAVRGQLTRRSTNDRQGPQV